MYEKISPANAGATGPRAPRDGRLIAVVAGSVLLAVLLLLPLGYFMRMMYGYHSYTQDLAASFIYGERNGTLSLHEGGAETAVAQAQAERLFAQIMNAGMGHPRRELPETGGLALTFGEGNELRIWPVPIAGKGRENDTGVRFRYIRPDGSSFSYDTDKLQYEDILRSLAAG